MDEELVTVAVPVLKTAEALTFPVADSPLSHASHTSRYLLRVDYAPAFLDQKFSWGETGKEFLARFQEGEHSISLAFEKILGQVTRNAGDQSGPNSNFHPDQAITKFLPELCEALERANYIGLLLIEKQPYFGRMSTHYYLNPEQSVRNLLELDKAEVSNSPVETSPPEPKSSFNLDTANRIFAEKYNEQGIHPLHTPISGGQILALFSDAHSMKELYLSPQLYRDGVAQFGRPVGALLDAVVDEAKSAGLLLTLTAPDGGTRYQLDAAAKKLLEVNNDNRMPPLPTLP